MTVEPEYANTENDRSAPVDPLLPPPFGPARRPGTVLVLFFMMWVGMIVVGSVVQFLFGFGANALVTELGVILLPILVILQRRHPWRSLMLNRPPKAALLLVAVTGVLGLAILLAEFSYWSEKVFPMPEAFKMAYLQAITAESPGELAFLVLAAAVIPGFCEEVAFRGYFQQVFENRYGRHLGVLIAAALFAVMHLDPWHLPALLLIGLYLGYLFVWTRSLWVPAVAHFANNAASVILVYMLPDASISQMDEAPPLWALTLGAAAFLSAIMVLRRRQSLDVPGREDAVKASADSTHPQA